MKFNKKLVVSTLSTVLGLGIVGSITGTVAWYQYSTRGTASLVGMSAGESGVLQLSADGGRNWKRDVASNDFFYTSKAQIQAHQIVGGVKSEDGQSIIGNLGFELENQVVTKNHYNGTSWELRGELHDKEFFYTNTNNWSKVYAYAWTGQAYENAPFPGQVMTKVEGNIYKVDLPQSSYDKIIFVDGSNYRADDRLRPCTWGSFGGENNKELPASGAFGNPILGVQEMTNWKQATADVDYFQFTVQIKAVDKSESAEGTLVARKVWISDIVLEDASVDAQGNANPTVNDALRMHLHIEGATAQDTKDFLIARTANTTLECYGQLDLDGDNKPDTVGGYDWEPRRNQPVVYGNYVENGTYDTNVWIDPATGIEYQAETSEGHPTWVKIHSAGDTKYSVVTTPQTSVGIADVESATLADGKEIGSTIAAAVNPEDQEYLTVTVTVWLEGWAKLGATPSAVWSPDTLKKTIHAGLKFEISEDAFSVN